MIAKYREHLNMRETEQSQPIPGEAMAKNSAGGFSFEVTPWDQLLRFLILGAEEGTYYAGERELTVENAQNVLACIQMDGLRTVKTIAEVSEQGRAPKNESALFTLALCAGLGDEATRKAAFAALPSVARTGTHLLHFTNFMEGVRGWGRAARRGVGDWFVQMSPDQLGYQFLKYAQRDGWSMRDLLRLAHPRTNDPRQNALLKYIAGQGKLEALTPEQREMLPVQIQAALQLTPQMVLTAAGRKEAVALISKHQLPREALPTQLLASVEVWGALLESMPITAMIRNLGKMTEIGLLKPLSEAAGLVRERLGNEEILSKARVHPIQVLSALMVYGKGAGFRGKLTWEPVAQVVDALDGAFYKSFQFVEPTGKNILIGLDVSGSMGGNPVNGLPFLDARTAAAAMCMVTARTEANHHIMAFSHEFVPFACSPRQRLDDIVQAMAKMRFGGTDCALPMLWALENKVPVHAFVVYTDNETWYGKIHPVQALRKYRDATGIPAKMIVNAMTATKFSVAKSGTGTRSARDPGCIADSMDGGMLDVAGLDSAAPKIMADFIRG